jgi:hypothetical protein
MINYGVDGMYFVSDHVFQNGAIIFFRICDWCADDQAGAIQPGFRSLAFAQVRWRETIESGHGKRFGYGVKFLAHR